jgi:hypothetical protein
MIVSLSLVPTQNTHMLACEPECQLNCHFSQASFLGNKVLFDMFTLHDISSFVPNPQLLVFSLHHLLHDSVRFMQVWSDVCT